MAAGVLLLAQMQNQPQIHIYACWLYCTFTSVMLPLPPLSRSYLSMLSISSWRSRCSSAASASALSSACLMSRASRVSLAALDCRCNNKNSHRMPMALKVRAKLPGHHQKLDIPKTSCCRLHAQ